MATQYEGKPKYYPAPTEPRTEHILTISPSRARHKAEARERPLQPPRRHDHLLLLPRPDLHHRRPNLAFRLHLLPDPPQPARDPDARRRLTPPAPRAGADGDAGHHRALRREPRLPDPARLRPRGRHPRPARGRARRAAGVPRRARARGAEEAG